MLGSTLYVVANSLYLVCFVALILLCIKDLFMPIFRLKKSEKDGLIEKVEGKIYSKTKEKKREVNGRTISVSYPIYEYSFNGKKQLLTSAAKQNDVIVGTNIEVLVNKTTGEAWVENDIRLQLNQFKISVVTVLLLMVLSWIVENIH